MKNIFRNSVKRIISFLLLGFFIFTFLHSELGFLDYDDHHHACRDYCEIVKNANTHSKFLQDKLLTKLERNKNICLHCIEVIEAQITQTCFERTDQHQIIKQFTEVYLFNRTFLI
jgi:tRNA(Ile)-lysidine synthase TilS/MesJ